MSQTMQKHVWRLSDLEGVYADEFAEILEDEWVDTAKAGEVFSDYPLIDNPIGTVKVDLKQFAIYVYRIIDRDTGETLWEQSNPTWPKIDEVQLPFASTITMPTKDWNLRFGVYLVVLFEPDVLLDHRDFTVTLAARDFVLNVGESGVTVQLVPKDPLQMALGTIHEFTSRADGTVEISLSRENFLVFAFKGEKAAWNDDVSVEPGKSLTMKLRTLKESPTFFIRIETIHDITAIIASTIISTVNSILPLFPEIDVTDIRAQGKNVVINFKAEALAKQEVYAALPVILIPIIPFLVKALAVLIVVVGILVAFKWTFGSAAPFVAGAGLAVVALAILTGVVGVPLAFAAKKKGKPAKGKMRTVRVL